ncbi:MAG TPA: hypothetical protein VLM76_06230 [Patescibacteria group bacterium]|nr:hypothetical protein [Patescibacteria group bacterium]
MGAQALGTGGTIARRRVFFGLLDAGGWAWATLKAAFWFVVIIMLLAYIPDRALYATVQPTIEIGVPLQTFHRSLNVTPINLCPASNETLPCPAPVGAVLPWQPNPPELGLPQARTNAAIVAAGRETLLVGGSDGTVAQDGVFATVIRPDGNIDGWTAGAPLPAPRAGAAAVFFAGSAYVIGGADAGGAPTDTVFVGTPDAASGKIMTWEASEDLKLPAPRADATAVVTGEGILLVGGRDAGGPVASVWQAPLRAATGVLQPWRENASLPAARTGAAAAILGTHLFVYGGEDADGPTGTVLRGEISAEAETVGQVTGFSPTEAAAALASLPQPRRGAIGFVSGGTLYYVGGEGGAGELYWTIPDADGNLPGWTTLAQSALPADLQLADAAPIVAAGHAFLVGGTAAGVATQGIARASLAPPQPFFRVGLFYVLVPALGIGGEVGQQLAYLVAAGVGTTNFALLIFIGYLYNHPGKATALLDRIRNRRRRAA